MTHARGTQIGIATLGVLTAVGVGAGLTSLWLVPERPPTLAVAQATDEVPVILQDFDDAQAVEALVERSPAVPLVSPLPGRVTSLDCRPGHVLESGHANVAVDGAAVLNLATRVPLWRDLTIGDVGDDVRAVQEELARLGLPVHADGTLGAASIRGLASLLSAVGGTPLPDDSIPMGRILWLPGPTVSIESCEIALGTPVEAGGVVATAAGPPAEIRVQQSPAGLLPGDRILDVDGLSAAVDADGRVSDAAGRAALSAAPSVRAALASEDSAARVSATLRLSMPVQVGVVPPSAVYAIDGADACVLVAGTSRSVHIQGSQLGQTFVTFEDGQIPGSVAATPNENAHSCR